MNQDELEKLIGAFLELSPENQRKASSLIYNWDSLGGNSNLNEASSKHMDEVVSASNDCWKTDINEFWVVFKSFKAPVSGCKISDRYLTPAKYGLHRMLLSFTDLTTALRLIKKDKGRTYTIPSQLRIGKHFKEDNTYIKKNVSYYAEHTCKDGTKSLRAVHDTFMVHHKNNKYIEGISPHDLHRFYLAQFET